MTDATPWLDGAPAGTSLEAALALRPDLADGFAAFLETLDREASLPPRLLAICSVRIAAIHGFVAPTPLSSELPPALIDGLLSGRDVGEHLNPAEQAALVVAEQMPHGQHSVTDAQVATLRAHFGPAGTVALLTRLAFYDVQARLRATLGLAQATS